MVEIDPGFDSPKATFDTLWHAGASRLLDGLNDAQRDALDPGLRAIAEHGKTLTLTDYLVAREARTALTAHMAEFHREFDLLVTPTMPITTGLRSANDLIEERTVPWPDPPP